MHNIRPRTECVLGPSPHVDESNSVSAERAWNSSSSTSPQLEASSTSTSSFWLDPRSAGSETSVSLDAQDVADARLEADRVQGRVGSQKLLPLLCLLDFSLPFRLCGAVSLRYGCDQRPWSRVGDCDWVRVRLRTTLGPGRAHHSGTDATGAVIGSAGSGAAASSGALLAWLSHVAGADASESRLP